MTKFLNVLPALIFAWAVVGAADATEGTPSAAAPSFDSVSISRGICYGPCPIYRVTITADGRVEYEGFEHVTVQGVHYGQLSAADLALLSLAIDRVPFDTFRPSYLGTQDGCNPWATDNPSVEFTLKQRGHSYHVAYNFGCGGTHAGPKLDWLARTIDELADTAQWVGRKHD